MNLLAVQSRHWIERLKWMLARSVIISPPELPGKLFHSETPSDVWPECGPRETFILYCTSIFIEKRICC